MRISDWSSDVCSSDLSSSTLSAVRDASFGVETIRSEARLLVSRLLPPRLGRLRYAAIERLGLFLYEPRLRDVRPTNGAIMLATAVALQPRHLVVRSEEHTSELQSLMRISYAVFCLKKKK